MDALPAGQTAAIITITASVLQAGISEKLAQLLQSFAIVVSSLVIALVYNWKLTLVTSSGLVLIVTIYSVTTPFVVRLYGQVQQADIKASTIANEIFSSVRMIAACGAETKMEQRYAGWVDESRKRGLKMPPLMAVQQAPIFFAIYATFALCFWYTFKMYMEFKITSPETLIVVLMSVMLMTTSIGGVTTPLSAAARAAGAGTIFYTVIDAPKPTTGGVKAPDVTATEDIVLQRINFAYPSRPFLKVLNNLCLRIPAGKITAIVGPSGSGKSTIVGLIERWYELDDGLYGQAKKIRNGTIMTCGRDLKDIDLKWWRSQIGLVQQEPFLFNDTIYKNVEHGLVGTEWEDASAEVKEKLIKQACQEAFADEFIHRLPEGYDTIPMILILDEATSSIDVRSERMVQAALDKVSKNRTTITIAHRLATVKKADNIVVLRKGQVVQQGTHESLMAEEGGAYWTLATAQQLDMGHDEDNEFLPTFSSLSEKKSLDIVETEENASGDTVDGSAHDLEKSRSRSFFASFGLLLREQKGHWRWYSVLLVGAIFAGASAPIHAYLFANLITLFQLFGGILKALANFWCLMFVMLAILVGISYFALSWSATTLAINITRTYQKEYFHNILSKSVAFFDAEDHSVGSLTARLATDPQQLQQLLGMNMAFVIISVFNVVGCLTISFYFGWKLTIVTLCSSMPLIFGAAFFRIRYETQFEKTNNLVFAESAKFATESIGACRTVASLTLEDTICKRYETLLKTQIHSALYKSAASTFLFALSDSISLICMAFVLWYGGNLMLKREYLPFQYVVVYIAVMQGGMGAGQWMSHGPNIAKATVAANRIIDMRAEDYADGRLISLDLGNIGDNDKGVKVRLENIWFKYPTRDVYVLRGLDITIEKGQFAAIVGPSGKFYAPSAGRIIYNGSDITYLSLAHYRKEISLVAQEPSLFNGTIRENILLGVDEYLVTDEDIHQACKDAGIHDFIVSLPEGYNTEVGNRGVALSGGQKQRLSIARALIRHPRLLLLDEATSNLDAETERAVQAVFEKNKRDRTMVVVAHRLATVQNADVIFVLGDGKVMESGNHSTLIQKKRMYYQMCLAQALDR
ncbi:hypothetical protein VTK73DRAFT_3538 [Phialemonium thermophilum]|uniref:Uncharacterized protein n=1 Tax=Phialemonium thermophilum TaxID=223376 RepID=A0ABR3XZL9_9PEZI